MVCHGGQCVSGCEVGGTFSGPNALNPTNACQSCQPSSTTTAWTDLADGAIAARPVLRRRPVRHGVRDWQRSLRIGCREPEQPLRKLPAGDEHLCMDEHGRGQRRLPDGRGLLREPGELHLGLLDWRCLLSSGATASSGCQVCNPGASTTAWTNVVGAASCPSGQACSSGACASGCAIGGTFYDSGATSNDGCEVCTPSSSTTSWTDATGAASCTSGQVCNAGSCASGRSIGGIFYAPAATTNDGCEICTPGTSTTAWTNATTGTNCGNGEVCSGGTCGTQCDIGGTILRLRGGEPEQRVSDLPARNDHLCVDERRWREHEVSLGRGLQRQPGELHVGLLDKQRLRQPGDNREQRMRDSARPHRARRRGRR